MQSAKLFIFIIVLAACADVSAKTKSPTESERLARAVQLLNEFSGNSEVLDAAHLELQAILNKNPRNAPAHREMARFFIKSGYINSSNFEPGALEAAEQSLNKAIEINPRFAEAYVLRGNLYRLMKRPQEAIAALKVAEQFGTSDPWLHNNWADLLIDEGKYEEAVQRYKIVINDFPQNRRAVLAAYDGLIKYYRRTYDSEAADEVYRKKIAVDPTHAWSYGNYGTFLLCERDDFDASIDQSRQALRIMDYGMARYWLAAALYRKWAHHVRAGNPEEGIKSYREASSLHPDPKTFLSVANRCSPLRQIEEALALTKNQNEKGG